MSANSILSDYVELGQPATKRNILALVDATDSDEESKALRHLASDGYDSEVLAKRVSVLDLLEKYPSINLPMGQFLAMLPPMRIRQ